MLLNAEELLALVNGDAEPDRLADLLDRLENCPDSAAALQVLVALRANREEGIEALREAAEADSRGPIPHPSARRPADHPTGWGTQALRLAASIAVVGILGVFAANTFLGTTTVVTLATEEYEDMLWRETPDSAEPTAAVAASLRDVSSLIEAKRYDEARDLLITLPDANPDRVAMYFGMIDYFTEDYQQALNRFAEVGEQDSDARHQALWYEANTFLALDRPMDALISLERLSRVSRLWWYQPRAAEAYDSLCEALGINSSSAKR